MKINSFVLIKQVLKDKICLVSIQFNAISKMK